MSDSPLEVGLRSYHASAGASCIHHDEEQASLPLNVYVVEDTDSLRKILSGSVRKLDHNVSAFSTAESALDDLACNPPELIFLDWTLPGISGLDFCKKIREMKNIFQPVIVMTTAKTDDDSFELAMSSGVDDYIFKPYSVKDMSARIRIAEERAYHRKERYLLEHKDREGGHYLADLTSSIPAGLLVVDEKTHDIIECNPYAAEMVGLSSEKICGRNCHQFICPREAGTCPISDRKENFFQCKTVILKAGGEQIRVLKTAQLATYHGKQVIIETFIDIEEQEQAQERLQVFARDMERLAMERAQQLIHSDRLALLGTMVAGLSHEISNCLTAIGPNIDMALKYWEEIAPVVNLAAAEPTAPQKLKLADAELKPTLDAVKAGAGRTTSLLSGLKNYSRKMDAGGEPFLLAGCVDDTLNLCHNLLKHGITVSTEIPGDFLVKNWNRQHMEQVLMNLVNNASQAMKGKGKIAFTLAAGEAQAVLTVEDNGPGIQADSISKIWEPFYTTKTKTGGTGLGLYIVKGIVDQYAGSIIVTRSEKLGGAAFIIKFPNF